MADTKELLSQGIAALKAGQKAKARGLLEQATQQDKQNEMAWLWLSGAVDTDDERRMCLQRVLAINPGNESARLGLQGLDSGPAASNATQQPMAESKTQRTETPIQGGSGMQNEVEKSNGDTEKLLHEIVELQKQQSTTLQAIHTRLYHVMFWIWILLALVGLSAYQIYERMGNMRVY